MTVLDVPSSLHSGARIGFWTGPPLEGKGFKGRGLNSGGAWDWPGWAGAEEGRVSGSSETTSPSVCCRTVSTCQRTVQENHNSAPLRQSRPDSGLSLSHFQAKVFKIFQVVPFSLNGWDGAGAHLIEAPVLIQRRCHTPNPTGVSRP